MGTLLEDRCEYLDALKHFQKAEQLIKPTVTQNRGVTAPSRPLFAHDITPCRLHILNNMGRMHLKDGEYQSAQDNFEAALQTTQFRSSTSDCVEQLWSARISAWKY